MVEDPFANANCENSTGLRRLPSTGKTAHHTRESDHDQRASDGKEQSPRMGIKLPRRGNPCGHRGRKWISGKCVVNDEFRSRRGQKSKECAKRQEAQSHDHGPPPLSQHRQEDSEQFARRSCPLQAPGCTPVRHVASRLPGLLPSFPREQLVRGESESAGATLKRLIEM